MNREEFAEKNRYLNEIISKKEEQLKKLEENHGRKTESYYADGLDVRSDVSVTNNGKEISEVRKELEELKAEKENLANSVDFSMEAAMKEQDEMIQAKKEQRVRDREAKHELYERLKRKYKAGSSTWERLKRKVQGTGLKKEADYTLEELKFLENYESRKPEFKKESILKKKERFEKQGLSRDKVNKELSKLKWDQFAKAVANKSVLHTDMESHERDIELGYR